MLWQRVCELTRQEDGMVKRATTSRRASAADASTQKAKRSRSAGLPKAGRAAGPPAAGSSTQPAEADAPIEGGDVPLGSLEQTAEAIGRTLGRTTAAIADHLPWTRGSDGLDMLERDHRRLEALLKQAVETDPESLDDRRAALAQLGRELVVHEQIEEKVLYPVLKSHAEAKDIVLEGYQEHHVADVLLKELQELPPSDERWGAKLKVLQESLQHHIQEEEGEMFKTARSVLSPEQLEEVGARMAAMQQELQAGHPSTQTI